MTVSVSRIGRSVYRAFEGPFFGGTIKVPIVGKSASFSEKVLSLTAAAEGGSWNAVNMYDSGLISVGAIQFIDIGFAQTDMVGFAAEQLGTELVLDALKPALVLCNVTFAKRANGKWRFAFANGEIVDTLYEQKMLYFGDAGGNALGSYNEAKWLRAKTWAAAMASMWEIPGATKAQCDFTLPRLMRDFVWGQLKTDLFTGEQPESGYVGALRAMLLAFAVNAPAVVIGRYANVRNNGAYGTPEWCLRVLRGVVVGAGIDVWPARWKAKISLVEKMFDVTLPTYAELVAGSWSTPEEPTVEHPIVSEEHDAASSTGRVAAPIDLPRTFLSRVLDVFSKR